MKLIIASVFLFLGTCKGSKEVSSSVPAQTDNSKIIITYQRGACMGRCPDYTMSINGEKKTIDYTGKGNVEKMGIYTKPITDAELTKLVEAFKTADFYSLDAKYLGQVTDLPSRYITYSKDGVVKKVQDRFGAPDKLKALEKLLEDIADSTEGWIKISETGN